MIIAGCLAACSGGTPVSSWLDFLTPEPDLVAANRPVMAATPFHPTQFPVLDPIATLPVSTGAAIEGNALGTAQGPEIEDTARTTPTATEFAATQTVTPTPELSTTDLSFDPSRIVKRTSPPPALCPTVKGLTPDFSAVFHASQPKIELPVLDYLNAGGSALSVVNAFRQYYGVSARETAPAFSTIDLTGDGVDEIVLSEPYLHVFGCGAGKYHLLLKLVPGGLASLSRLVAARDMNLDGVVEIVVERQGADVGLLPGGSTSPGKAASAPEYALMGWNGEQFENLCVQPDFQSPLGAGSARGGWLSITGLSDFSRTIWENWSIADVDYNGTLEFILQGGLPPTLDEQLLGPWRAEQNIYAWDGAGFVLKAVQRTSPDYRFQAVQDADAASLAGDYKRALGLYQEVIFNRQLDWWSAERAVYENSILMAQWKNEAAAGTAEPTLLPINDLERANLAAYARYRMVLIYLRSGWFDDAWVAYDILQHTFPAEKPGHAFAEMAEATWVEYQNTQSLEQACAKAVEYAARHATDTLVFLGNTDLPGVSGIFHGWQSKLYQPVDVCPFK